MSTKYLAAVRWKDGTVVMGRPDADIAMAASVLPKLLPAVSYRTALYQLRLLRYADGDYWPSGGADATLCGLYRRDSEGLFMWVLDAAPSFHAAVDDLRCHIESKNVG